MKILLIGSGHLAASILPILTSFNNVDITVMDRKDPSGIKFINNDCRRIMEKYCKDMTYMDVYNSKQFGEKKRKMSLCFDFTDWTNETLEIDSDIIIFAGSVYDSLYSGINTKEMLRVNINGFQNLMFNMKHHTNEVKEPLFIHMSSINVYGNQADNVHDEITEDDTTPNPQDLLNFSLYNQENLLKALCPTIGVDYLILRLGNLVGYFTPVSSLVNSAMKAVLTSQPTFDLYRGNESIEILDIIDLQQTMNAILQSYENGKYDELKNQVINLKAEEKEPKTVDRVIGSMYNYIEKLPTIVKEHRIPGIHEFKIKAPKVMNIAMDPVPRIKWNVTISIAKAAKLLNYVSMKPLTYSIMPGTVSYLLSSILDDEAVPEAKRQAFEKIYNIPKTPRPDNLYEDVPESVKQTVTETHEKINHMNPVHHGDETNPGDWDDHNREGEEVKQDE